MDYRLEAEKYGLYDSRFEHDSCGVGFVCDIKGRKSNAIIRQGLEALKRLSHRGATGADPKTGDGAGILIQTPHQFFIKAAQKAKIDLPLPFEYGTGLVFLPRDDGERSFCKDVFAKLIKKEGQILLGFREVPVDDSDIGKTAKDTQPAIEQVFIGEKTAQAARRRPQAAGSDGLAFERKLYLIRKQVENIIRASNLKEKSSFYIPNISCRTFSYKGLLMPAQVEEFFCDLKDQDLKSAICLVHSRYSTNTFPTWDLAQPFRFLAHNGEINTLRGNINWMRAREGILSSPLFGKALKKIKPVIVPGGSDSAAIDNVFELLVLSGRALAHAMMMLIPGAWEQDGLMDEKLKNFYKYHGCFMEPWDGPAAIAFTDGISIGAVLDRNGLRPARYLITKQDLVVMASEVGVLDIPASDILFSGRLEPGKMFFIDTEEGRIIDDEKLKEEFSRRRPYGAWLKHNLLELDKLPAYSLERRADKKDYTLNAKRYPPEDILVLLKAFGYSREDLKVIIKPMALEAKEPTGSMGNDTPHAVLSKHPQLLYTYFKQLFAQVTNPAIDPIREELVMSMMSFVGMQRNILDETPGHCHKMLVKDPVLTNEDLEKIRKLKEKGFKTKVISILFRVDEEKDFLKTLRRVCKESVLAIEQGYSFIILSDRGVDKEHAALPSLMACGAVHQHLIRKALRSQLGIIIESGEPREVHHFALLFGYGADCINPYLVYQSLEYLIAVRQLQLAYKTALKNYRRAVDKGILKILSKMGISTLASYRGAQIFEALGINREVIEECFSGTVSRINGAGYKEIAQEALLRHRQAYPKDGLSYPYLSTGGIYQWKRDGEFHLWNPESIADLQEATRLGDYNKYKEFASRINDQSENPATLRGLLKFRTDKVKAVPIEEVEPAEEIFKRFATGAMSFGSISKCAHETLAIAMNRIKGRSNTGEGGEDPARFVPFPNGDSARSAIKQVASGRFGVTTNYLVNADELQIKIAQGAKPGEGGQLPGHKVSVTIARTRYTTPGVTLISPPPHHDIYSIEDLAQLIFDLKNVNPLARISVKLVSEFGVGTIAAGVAKGHADMILISGGDGGTGASPLSSIKHAGLPWELGISETHQTLVLNDLRNRVRLQVDGQMRTGRDVAIAALLGAEEYGFSTAALIVSGCVMLRHCHLNTCSVGVATQDELLEKRFRGKPEYLINYFTYVARELREIMASLGIRKLNKMIGRTELLELNSEIIPWKAKKIDYSRILYKPRPFLTGSAASKQKGRGKPKVPETVGTYCSISQNHGIDKVLDLKLIKLARPALEDKKPVKIELPIENINRTTGAMLSGEVCIRYGEDALEEGTIHCKFKGVAGQSFGAWLANGITFELEGMANDYVGKGISGGKIIIYPDKDSAFEPGENIIIGNTTFYGAISGEAYIRGAAGERFCIRNSGLLAVVEGLGDHGCEYMTGGRVVVLGRTGRNFAAGMSGGITYVYDIDGSFKKKCNLEMVALEEINPHDAATINGLLRNHYNYTASSIARKVLGNFKKELKEFIKVMPLEYKRILEQKKLEEKLDLVEVSD